MATILLVEDDEILRLAAAHHLEKAGFAVIAAAKSNDALDELDLGRHIDLAVIDVCMPRGQVNGLALARMARWRRPGLPILFVTGYPEVLEAESSTSRSSSSRSISVSLPTRSKSAWPLRAA